MEHERCAALSLPCLLNVECLLCLKAVRHALLLWQGLQSDSSLRWLQVRCRMPEWHAIVQHNESSAR
jgi:hypothetical protein